MKYLIWCQLDVALNVTMGMITMILGMFIAANIMMSFMLKKSVMILNP